MLYEIPNTCISITKPSTNLESYLYRELCKMFNIDIENDLNWYEKMAKEALEHFGDIIKLPISQMTLSHIDKRFISMSPNKVAVFKIEYLKNHPLHYRFRLVD